MAEYTDRLKVVIDFIVKNLRGVATAGAQIQKLMQDAQKAGIAFTKSGKAVVKGTGDYLSVADALTEISKTQVLSKMKADEYKAMMDRLRVTAFELNKRMREQHIELREGGVWWDQMRRRELTVREATQLLRHGIRRFRMELLSVMFFGMQIGKMFESWLKPAMEAYGIFDMWNSMLLVTFIPVMDDLAPALYAVMDAFMNLPEPVQKAIGWISIAGLVAGKALYSFGALGLGIIGLREAFPIFDNLATSFSAAAGSVKGAVTGIIGKFVALKEGATLTAETAAMGLINLASVAIVAGLIIYSAWKESQHAMSLSHKMEMDKRKKDWDSYKTHALMRAIETQYLVPRVIHRMLYTVGNIVHGVVTNLALLWFDLRNAIYDSIYGAVEAVVGMAAKIPGVGDTFRSLLKDMTADHVAWVKEQTELRQKLVEQFTNMAADASMRFEQNMQNMRYEATKQMIAMGIPIQDIIEEYGEEQGAIEALLDAAKEGKITWDALSEALDRNKSVTEGVNLTMQTTKAHFSDLTNRLEQLKTEANNSFTSLMSGSTNMANTVKMDTESIKSDFTNMTAHMTSQTMLFKSQAIGDFSTVRSQYEANMTAMVNATRTAVNEINATLNRIKREIVTRHRIIVEKTYRMFWGFGGFRFFQEGGIVLRPTVGVLGERGPEAVIPLRKLKNIGGYTINYNPTINITAQVTQEVDIDRIMSRVDDYIVGRLRQMVS